MSFELLSMNAGKNFFLDETINQKNVNEGQLSIIKPNVAHTMVFTKDTTFLNLSLIHI